MPRHEKWRRVVATGRIEGQEVSEVLFEVDGAIATVTLNRAAYKNTLTATVFVELAAAWQRIETDQGIRAVILTAAGDDVFSAGGDLGTLIPLLTGARSPETDAEQAFLADPRLVDRALLKAEPGLPALTGKPIIAAVNGAAIGGGFELVQAADLRIAVPHARFALPEVQRAIVPSGGAMVRLPRQLPWAVAMELLLTGDPMEAEQARHWGLINHIVEPASLLDSARALAARIAANGPLAVRAIKDCATRSAGLPLSEAFAIERERAGEVMASLDAREGPRAFKEKRPPVYQGR